MYSFRKTGDRYVVSIDNHAEIVCALTAFCDSEGIRSGSISGIGAIAQFRLQEQILRQRVYGLNGP